MELVPIAEVPPVLAVFFKNRRKITKKICNKVYKNSKRCTNSKKMYTYT